MTNTNAAALAQLGEKMRARQRQATGLSTRQLNWLSDGYNLGYLTAEECKTRFGQLIDEMERMKDQPT